MTRRKVKRVSLLGVVLVGGVTLLGVGIGTGGPAGASGATQAGTAPKAAAPTMPYVGKPRPPVEVLLAPGAPLESGVPGLVTLWVRAPSGIEGIDLAVEGDEGLAVVSVARDIPGTGGTGYQSAGEAARFEIAATPMSGGTRHVSGLVRFTVNGVDQAAPFRVTIEVDGPVTMPPVRLAKPSREPVRDWTGELIDSMQAETTVR